MDPSVTPTPRVHVYPDSDSAFKAHADGVAAALGGQPIFDERILAAAEALLRASYPLATVQVRDLQSARSGDTEWDLFRDVAVRDDEMVRRVGHGDQAALGDLYDRYHRMALAISSHLTNSAQLAIETVAAAFVAATQAKPDVLPFRRRLIAACRDATATWTLVNPSAMSGEFGRETVAIAVVDLARNYGLNRFELAELFMTDAHDIAVLATEALRVHATRRRRLERRPIG